MSPKISKKVMVGLSGGVDSAVAAYLLKKQGYSVEGLFMKNWENETITEIGTEKNTEIEENTETPCSASEDIQFVEDVCKHLEIPIRTVNFTRLYWDRVFEHFLAEYQAGRTPNPDILCNQEIKFKAFLEHALSLGADFIATGHYASVEYDQTTNTFQLQKACDLNKDQSYFLHRLTQTALSKSLFPLSDYTKPQVRTLAKTLGFLNHDRKDSTGICFIGERRFKSFLNSYLPAQPGNIETLEGTCIGTHDGLMFYTLGQRQGLKIGGRKDALPDSPWYVIDKDLKRNVLIVGQGENHPVLFKRTLTAKACHWIAGETPTSTFECTAKIRYRQSDQSCRVTLSDKGEICQVIFTEEQRAITPGQSIVFYNNSTCLGGGIIQ